MHYVMHYFQLWSGPLPSIKYYIIWFFIHIWFINFLSTLWYFTYFMNTSLVRPFSIHIYDLKIKGFDCGWRRELAWTTHGENDHIHCFWWFGDARNTWTVGSTVHRVAQCRQYSWRKIYTGICYLASLCNNLCKYNVVVIIICYGNSLSSSWNPNVLWSRLENESNLLIWS